MTFLTRRWFARLVAFVSVLLVVFGPWVVVEPSTHSPLRDARSLTTATLKDHRAPAAASDGVTSVTPARIGDSAPVGRNRAHWFGDLLGSLVLFAAWGATRRTWFLQQRTVIPAGRTWSGRSMGRAPPVATIR